MYTATGTFPEDKGRGEMKMRPRRYRVYAVTFGLMALGVLSQWLLLTGHIPFSRLVRIHARSGLEVPRGMGGQRGAGSGGRGGDTNSGARPRRPAVPTRGTF